MTFNPGPMTFNPTTEDALTELNSLRDKAQAVLTCVLEDTDCARPHTLTRIASDYLFAMGELIRAMQACKVTASQ
jgi:hypothetical protein